MTKEKAEQIFQLLKSHYPHAKMILQWGNNFELLVAIVLSAQCTDKKVNEVTAVVFPKYQQKRKELEDRYANYSRILLSKGEALSVKGQGVTRVKGTADAQELVPTGTTLRASAGRNERQDPVLTRDELIEIVNLAHIPLAELEQDIKSTGFYHAKAKSVQGAAKTVLEKFNGILPRSIAELITIPGVGRKTANVFLTNAYHVDEGIAVDTHVTKQAKLLELTNNTDPVKIEQDLMQLFPQNQWHNITYMLIEHGRNMRKKKSDRIVCNDPKCVLCNPQ